MSIRCVAEAVRTLGRRWFGSSAEKFATSAGDAHMFAAACGDGYAQQLLDVRHPLPIVTFNSGKL